MNNQSMQITRRNVLLASAAGTLALVKRNAAAQDGAKAGFSFAAYGDSRPMMYLPFKEGSPKFRSCSARCSGWSCRRRSRPRWSRNT